MPSPTPMPARDAGLPRRELFRLLTAAGVVGAGTALTACTSGSSTSPSSSPSGRSPGDLDVSDFGAVGDGRTDDLAAIRRALTAVRPGGTLRFGRGKVFCHSQVLTVDTPDITLAGPGTLRATAESSSAVQVQAANVQLRDITLAMGTTTQRWSTPDQHKLYLGSHSGAQLTDVVVEGSAAAGIFCDGASDFRLERVTVRDTRADGIHMTNGSHGGRLVSPSVHRSGDDGVAVVSYLADQGPCHDITVTSATVDTTTGGRGISVVGGSNVQYSDINIRRSSAAAVYIACEGGDFVTSSTENVQVDGGRIAGANTDAAIDHGAVLVYSGRAGGEVKDVTIRDLSISGTRPGASRQIGVVADGAADLASDVTFDQLRMAASPQPYQGNAPRSSFTLRQVTAAGATVDVPA